MLVISEVRKVYTCSQKCITPVHVQNYAKLKMLQQLTCAGSNLDLERSDVSFCLPSPPTPHFPHV